MVVTEVIFLSMVALLAVPLIVLTWLTAIKALRDHDKR